MPPDDASASGRLGKDTQVIEETDSEQVRLTLEHPDAADGAELWSLARDAGNLDVNSRYAYLLWCRDFADTTVVARDGERLAGFLTAYRRPRDPETYFVWQMAVSSQYRRRGLARRMLDFAVDSQRPQGVRFVETTVTPDNKASMRVFESFASANDAELSLDVLFSEQELGTGHEPEVLHRIGPLARTD